MQHKLQVLSGDAERCENLQQDQALKVGELAKRTGKSVRALHLYEELGLLQPILRSKGGFRLFAQAAVTRVNWISKLQDMGFSLTSIRDIVTHLEEVGAGSAPDAMGNIRELFQQKLEETRMQVKRLASLEGELAESLAYLETCKTCDIESALEACTACSLHDCDHKAPELIVGFRKS